MRLRDWTFHRVFSNLFVYNILFEDTEVDERFLGVNEKSRVLGISGAGCGIANHLSQRPLTVDAVDINKHHLALTALKVGAARRIKSYDEYYAMLGTGFHPGVQGVLPEITEQMPRWIQQHWSERHKAFSKSIYDWGLTARLFGMLRTLAGVDADWLRGMIRLSVEERNWHIDQTLKPVLRRPWVEWVLNSPVNLVALGVNFTQCERMMSADQEDLVDFLVMHIKRVAATDLERNWFAWFAIAGHYNHERDDAVPPFLRRDHHEHSYGSPTKVNYHHRNLFDVLREAGPKTWTHYTLCDAIDWMSHDVQHKLLSEILRTSQDGAVVLYRSVENDSLVARHGLEKRLQLMSDESDMASALDRTRQYQRVNFYRVVH